MVEIDIVYTGQLQCQAVHRPSKETLTTDPPLDNQGKGESFSPSDLVATALGTCMMTIMGITARRLEIDLTGTQVTVTKEMVTAPVRRIGRLGVTIHVPRDLPEEQKIKLQSAAQACPVCRSLHPDIQTPVEFRWG
jgi:putative redox protein